MKYDLHSSNITNLTEQLTSSNKSEQKQPVKETPKIENKVPVKSVVIRQINKKCLSFSIPPLPPEPTITEKDLVGLDKNDKDAITKKLLEHIRNSHNHHMTVSKLYSDAIVKHKEVCDDK